MNNFQKKDDLVYIDKCFTSIKNHVAIEENLKKISNALKRLFNINVDLSVVDNKTNTFFGMTVYPSISTMDLLVDSIVNKKSSMSDIVNVWEKNHDWHVEIDSILLYDLNLNTSPTEMTAVLLHEIGHVVYNNTIPQRLYKIMRFKLMKLNYQMKELISTEKIRKIFNITIVECCDTKNYRYVDNEVEKTADMFVVHNGYGNELNSFIDKLIKSQGNSLVDRSDEDMEKEITSVINWTVMNIKELEFRKKNLRTALRVEMLKTPSVLTKKIIQNIYNSFFGEATDKYRVLLSENAGYDSVDIVAEMEADQRLDQFVNKVLKEASNNIFDKNGRLKKITQNDIDILSVEAERIETTDDKIYLLDKLYSYMELVDMGIDYIESNEKDLSIKVTQSKRTLEDMKKQLQELRANILAYKIIDKSFGVFIKSPKGYEG